MLCFMKDIILAYIFQFLLVSQVQDCFGSPSVIYSFQYAPILPIFLTLPRHVPLIVVHKL